MFIITSVRQCSEAFKPTMSIATKVAASIEDAKSFLIHNKYVKLKNEKLKGYGKDDCGIWGRINNETGEVITRKAIIRVKKVE